MKWAMHSDLNCIKIFKILKKKPILLEIYQIWKFRIPE